MCAANIQMILMTNSTDRYFIEYDGFLSNHVSHGIVALSRLGASPNRIERFVKWYSSKLEGPTSDISDKRDVQELKGERASYYRILEHYGTLLQHKYKTVDEMISGEFPKLSLGIGGSALHGTNHLGYGYSAKNERNILEGLAYLYHSFTPIVTKEPLSTNSFGKGDVEILDLLTDVAYDDQLRQSMLEGLEQKEWNSIKYGLFQTRVSFLLTTKGDMLVDYILRLKIPANAVNPVGEVDTRNMSRAIVQWAVTVYALSERKNDFFLLHGVTCAWSLMQIMPLLNNADAVKVMEEFLIVFIAVYIAQNAPALNVQPENLATSPQDWDNIITETIAEDRDEHCYKLVQVCYEIARETPNCGSICMQAARSVLDNEFIDD